MMKFKDYFLNKITEILGTFFVLFLMLEFLYIIGNTFSVVFMIGVVIAILIMTKYLMDWYRKKKYFEIITERVKDLKEPWLIAELLPVSYTIEDEIYQELLRKVGSSAIEEIHKIEDEQKEYEDYIEQWIHEVKTPITSIHLMLENRISENPGLKRDLNVELSRLENDVELALYYARSEQIYRDYLIQKLNFRKVLLKVVNKNRTVIMNSSVAIDLDCDEALYAYGDEKWLVFMLTQVLLNAIKYKAEADAKVVMRAKRDNKRIVLNIIDNGKGIKKEELPRIFDKGFTGSNGRDNEKSTGMGLYLVHKLCEKLEIDIKADSVYGEFTEISFSLKNVC
ncbi:sensor histidine kinase [Agathobacter rectalis]|nr:sensor histidine kinase [Agathobacter rectalis]